MRESQKQRGGSTWMKADISLNANMSLIASLNANVSLIVGIVRMKY